MLRGLRHRPRRRGDRAGPHVHRLGAGGRHVGATPVLCDVLDGTGLIDPDAARAAVGPRTAAILAVHLYGQACDMDAIEAFAEPRGLLVLEDAAQAHGATLPTAGAPARSAHAAAFSFYPSKNLGALGDGGAICTDDDDAGGPRSPPAQPRPAARRASTSSSATTSAWTVSRRRCCGSSSLTSTIGTQRAAGRARVRYRELLEPSVRLVEERPESPSVHHLFPARFENRDAVASDAGGRGIETGVHYAPPIHAASGVGERSAATRRGARTRRPGRPRSCRCRCIRTLNPEEIERVAEAVHAAICVPSGRMGRESMLNQALAVTEGNDAVEPAAGRRRRRGARLLGPEPPARAGRQPRRGGPLDLRSRPRASGQVPAPASWRPGHDSASTGCWPTRTSTP